LKLQEEQLVIDVLKPEGAAVFGIPAPGTIFLGSGADARETLFAEARVFSP
jgi:hypothetical protein